MVFATLGAACYLAAHEQTAIIYRMLGNGAVAPVPSVAAGAYGSYVVFVVLAAGCIQLRLLCNLLDGLVALEGGRKGKAGDLFNEAPDRYADVVLAGSLQEYLRFGLEAGIFHAS